METILLVEDEAGLRDLLRKILRRQGYTVIEACDGAAAERLFETHANSIDLLLTDVVMPNMGGIELSQKLLAIRPGVKIVYMTGYAQNDALTNAVDRGAELIQKPFTPQALSKKIRKALGPSD
jgi:two-component system, cell cycle sensor histidine kinase and response regulator CckA